MPTTTMLSADELERMMASVSAPVQSDREARRLATKALSEQRTSQWPNTLEAMRKKKDRWKKDREEKAEEVRKQIDAEEMRFQRDARMKQVERANRLLFEQTDRMKTLRSKQLLADVVHHRNLQLDEKAMLKEQDERVEHHFAEQLYAKVKQEEEEEQRERKRRQQEAARLSGIQKQQLEEYKQKYIKELREEKEDGKQTKQKAEQDLKLEQDKEQEHRARMRQAAAETQLANMRLKEHKEKQLELERLEDTKREEGERKRLHRNAKREAMVRVKKEQAETRKQRMIDLATENLLKMEPNHAARLLQQSTDVRTKEDKELKARADRRAAEKEAIHRSRQQQIETKELKTQLEEEEAYQAVQQWSTYGKRIDMQHRQEIQDTRLENLRFAVEQKQQADARRNTLMEERAALFLAQRESTAALSRENERFQEVALVALQEARDHGLQNVFPIKKAIIEKRVDLLPASGFRI